ncbi:response regulator transcription factor [Terriglobus sp. ADX1]|uniref:response regulator transcription factor n=1 Tax=Terriglobus sp. ADX1 TaxID=2794063 RepID=UPI002FE5F479
MTNSPIRLLFVDDHTLFRESVVRLLVHEPDMTVVSHCATLADSRQVLMTQEVDVVLLDYDLGNEVGTRLLETLPQLLHAPRFLLVTGGMEVAELQRALNAGASGVVLKHSDPRQLLRAIRAVAEGNQWWDESAMRMFLAPAKRITDVHNPVVTERQRQILHHILDGLSNKEIGAVLGISETAVKASIQELFHKAGVRTRSQLVRVALERHSEDWLKPRS